MTRLFSSHPRPLLWRLTGGLAGGVPSDKDRKALPDTPVGVRATASCQTTQTLGHDPSAEGNGPPATDSVPPGRRGGSRKGVGRLVFLSIVSVLIAAACAAEGQGGCQRSLIAWGQGWSAPAAKDGVVFVGTRQGEILALDVNKNGRLNPEEQVIWRFAPEDRLLGSVFGPPAVGPEFVYVGDTADREGKSGRIYALRRDRESSLSIQRDTGEWVRPPEQGEIGAIVGSPVMAGDLVLVGSNDRNLYAFDTTGKIAWQFPTEQRIWSTPAVRDGVVYFGSMDRHVYALSLAEGLGRGSDRLLWKYETGGAIATTPLLLDGMVIVGSFDRKLYALDSRTGAERWSIEGTDWFWAGAVSDGERIFAPAMDGTVYAIDKDGAPIWDIPFKAESPIVSTPVIVDDTIVLATDEGKLHLLSTESGEKLEVSKDLDARVKAPLSRDGNMIFVGVEDSTVRGVDVEDWVEVWRVSTEE